ncbi:unnamed protein product [Psylliodes chrysocephalus]|uniref:Cathepsin propeptide inhibitor domain-containing protein n=1 Tax=Psylliodes chrysocephalus TaxID=3402493 RepID=A0A9P0CMW6_9CUCU|nr:unnamed protein product [Psylliodes chrysocephala]
MFHKFTVLFLVAASVVAVSAISSKALSLLAAGNHEDHKQFEEFKKNFNKQYTPEEEKTRFQNFQKTLRHIEENNAKFAKGEVSHTEGINQFSDLSADEWAQRNHGHVIIPEGLNQFGEHGFKKP